MLAALILLPLLSAALVLVMPFAPVRRLIVSQWDINPRLQATP